MAFLDSHSPKINQPTGVCVCGCAWVCACVSLGHFAKVLLFNIVSDRIRHYKELRLELQLLLVLPPSLLLLVLLLLLVWYHTVSQTIKSKWWLRLLFSSEPQPFLYLFIFWNTKNDVNHSLACQCIFAESLLWHSTVKIFTICRLHSNT